MPEVTFDELDARVVLHGQAHETYLTLEVAEVHGDSIDELALFNVPLTLSGKDARDTDPPHTSGHGVTL